MSPTKIAWATETWNPVTGCSKVSPGCANCYAERLSTRFGRTTKPWTPEHAAENVVLHPERLSIPLHWQKPRRIFVCSTADLFHRQVPSWYIQSVWRIMARCPQHTFLVLTKRSDRMLAWVSANNEVTVPTLPNVWLGVSIENGRFLDRAFHLRQTPAAIRFVSAEPLLGPLAERCANCEDGSTPGHANDASCLADWHNNCPVQERCSDCHGTGWTGLDLTDIDWLIIGGESGPHARPMDPQWALDLVEAARVVGTKVFVKQGSGPRPGTQGDLPDWAFALREYPDAPQA